jgi:peptidyl-prolyl cis-trans isomerase B (cyclophilin B)
MYKFLIPLFALALLIGCTKKSADNTELPPSTSSNAAMVDEQPLGFDGQMLQGTHRVVMKTSKGDITIDLDANKAPKAVTNFVVLANMGYYDGLTFHRVIPGFMIQGGDPNGNGTGGASIYGETFEDESNNEKMVRGVIAMANRGPNTNGSQFFIVTAEETPWLQGRHTIFGKVVEGMDVVDKISNVPRNGQDMPNTEVTFEVTVEE